jgi:hypothetical protein
MKEDLNCYLISNVMKKINYKELTSLIKKNLHGFLDGSTVAKSKIRLMYQET